MKETELKIKEEVKIVKEVKQEKKTILVGRLFPHENHKCFQYNTVSGELSLAEYQEISISFEAAKKGEIAPIKKIMMKENCIYITALNKKNALKKLKLST